jgi:hypothetical protein
MTERSGIGRLISGILFNWPSRTRKVPFSATLALCPPGSAIHTGGGRTPGMRLRRTDRSRRRTRGLGAGGIGSVIV